MKKIKTKILLFDLETSPNIGYTWGKYEQNVVEFTQDWHMLSVAWKWLGEKKTHVVSLPDFENIYKRDKTNDIGVVKKLHELFEEADIVIAHNGDSFDIKKAHARFIFHKMSPPSPFKKIDTKKVAKRYFRFDSNKLDDLGEYFGVGRKIHTGGFELWKGCMAGDMDAWKKMCKYNKQDVILLENIYNKMRPWMDNHPHVGALLGLHGSCPNCAGSKLHRRGFIITTGGKKAQRLQCQDCGAWTLEKKLTKVSK